MNKFQTAASRTEEKVREMLPPETMLRKPWQLVRYELLSNNFIIDISTLGKLKNLQGIILDDNKISDITPLKDLKQVRQLGLENNKVSCIKAVMEQFVWR